LTHRRRERERDERLRERVVDLVRDRLRVVDLVRDRDGRLLYRRDVDEERGRLARLELLRLRRGL